MMNDSCEIHELVLSAIDLISMSKTFSEEELRKIFDRIESTSDGAYRHYEAVLDDIEQAELRKVMDDMLNSLPEKYLKVLKMRFFDNMTLKECAEQIGTTLDGVKRIIEKALRELRKPSANLMELRAFVSDEVIYDFAMRRKGVSSFRISRESSTESAVFHLIEYREKLRKKMEHSLVDYADIEKLWELHNEVFLQTQ